MKGEAMTRREAIKRTAGAAAVAEAPARGGKCCLAAKSQSVSYVDKACPPRDPGDDNPAPVYGSS